MCGCSFLSPLPTAQRPQLLSVLLSCATESLILSHFFCSDCTYVDIDSGPRESGKLLLLFLCFGINDKKCIRPYICLPDVLIAACTLAIQLPFSLLVFLCVLQSSLLTVQSCSAPGFCISQCQWSTHVLDLGHLSLNLIFVLYRSDGLSCTDCGWCVGCGFFKLFHGRRKPVLCGKAKNFCFPAHLCAESKPLEHGEELSSFWGIKSIFVTA